MRRVVERKESEKRNEQSGEQVTSVAFCLLGRVHFHAIYVFFRVILLSKCIASIGIAKRNWRVMNRTNNWHNANIIERKPL